MLVTFKCACMMSEGTFDVRHRRTGEDIADWMKEVQRRLGFVHRKRSPLCRAPTVEYVKLEIEDGTPIGAPKKGKKK